MKLLSILAILAINLVFSKEFLVKTSNNLDMQKITEYNGKNFYLSNNNVHYNNTECSENSELTTDLITWNLDQLDNKIDLKYLNNYTGKGINVYVVDSGISNNLEFSNVKTEIIYKNFDDCTGHGTHVASIISGKRVGVSKDVNIIPVKVFDCSKKTTVAQVLQGLYWIIKQEKGIINLSLSGKFNSMLNNAVNDLTNAGFIVVSSAGNNGENACDYSPSSAEKSITVGCMNKNNEICDFSNEGKCVHIFAPGENILGGWIGKKNSLKKISGTSMAAPHVTGIIAQILEKYPLLYKNLNKDSFKIIKNIIINLAINNSLIFLKNNLSPNLNARIINNNIKCDYQTAKSCRINKCLWKRKLKICTVI